MTNILPKPDDVMKGEVDYYFPNLAQDLRVFTDEMLQSMKKKYDNDELYKVALLITMLSSEEKTVPEIVEAMGQKEEFVTLGQELLAEFIDVCRAVHMRMFLDMMEKYSTNTEMTIRLLNLEIKKFVFSEVKLEYDNNI